MRLQITEQEKAEVDKEYQQRTQREKPTQD
jgi:hypothetical protein